MVIRSDMIYTGVSNYAENRVSLAESCFTLSTSTFQAHYRLWLPYSYSARSITAISVSRAV